MRKRRDKIIEPKATHNALRYRLRTTFHFPANVEATARPARCAPLPTTDNFSFTFFLLLRATARPNISISIVLYKKHAISLDSHSTWLTLKTGYFSTQRASMATPTHTHTYVTCDNNHIESSAGKTIKTTSLDLE